jgi:hypothetical protein
MNFILLTLGSTFTISTLNYAYNKLFTIDNKEIEQIVDVIIDKSIDDEINELMNIEFPEIDDKTKLYIDNIINPQINTIINKTIEYINPENELMNIEI